MIVVLSPEMHWDVSPTLKVRLYRVAWATNVDKLEMLQFIITLVVEKLCHRKTVQLLLYEVFYFR